MLITSLVIALFAIMLVFPLVGSYLSHRFSEIDVLPIDERRTKDPRYFSTSFQAIMDRALDARERDGTLMLSKRERVTFATRELPSQEYHDVVIAQGDRLSVEGGTRLWRELLAAHDAVLHEAVQARAVCARGNLALGGGSQIERWVDAEETLTVYDDCDLGVSASSAQHLMIGRNCRFTRLYAPVIDVSSYVDDVMPRTSLAHRPFVAPEIRWGGFSIDHGDGDNAQPDDTQADSAQTGGAQARDDTSAPCADAGVVNRTIVTPHNVDVLDGVFLAGSVRSHGAVRLCDKAVVCGNVFAEGDVTIGRGCRVLGSVFSQESVSVDDGVELGTPGQLRSVVAREHVRFYGRARVYGYVDAGRGGSICLDEDTGNTPDDRPKRRVVLRRAPQTERIVASPSLNGLEGELTTYRSDQRVVRARVPAGAERIPRSLFFRCAKLRSANLPPSLKAIGDFAFFACENLVEINLSSCTALEWIGESAFEGCSSLERVSLPASLHGIGTAAFRNCTRLRSVAFGEPARLRRIESHAFMGCTALPAIALPEGVTHVGTSAFRGCELLRRLRIPSSATEIGAFAVAECASCTELSVPRALTEAESVGLPDGMRVTVRPEEERDAGNAACDASEGKRSADEGGPSC